MSCSRIAKNKEEERPDLVLLKLLVRWEIFRRKERRSLVRFWEEEKEKPRKNERRKRDERERALSKTWI